MDGYRLVRPTMDHEEKYTRVVAEPGADAEKMPFATRPRGRTYAEMIRDLSIFEVAPPEGFVPSTAFFFVDENDEILGFLDLRHHLNENLEKVGGHIGYGLRPSARGKRLTPKMLALGLDEARKLGLARVLLTCDITNLASAATIRRCGGRLTGAFTDDDGTEVQQYWIDLN